MLSVAEAQRLITARLPRWPAELVPLPAAAGRVLAEDVAAERDQPPFDRVTMDGIAIRAADLARGERFRIQATQAAGDPPLALADDTACIEIMTGAVLPGGADCVIPVESIDVDAGWARVRPGYEAHSGQFIHRRGSDRTAGAPVLRRGQRLRAPELAVLAGNGLARVSVARRPRLAVISTGNELVEPGRPIAPHQIRSSNAPAIIGALASIGLTDIVDELLPDDATVLERRLGEQLRSADVMILTGGVSMGKFDYLPGVLQALGVELVFHKVAQRPGKPMWFGVAPGGRPIFALPGNPVSTLVCLHRYVLPALQQAAGEAAGARERACLGEAVEFAARLTLFMPVHILCGDDGVAIATPAPTNTSGDFTALAGTDGFIELPAEPARFEAGHIAPLYRWG